MFPGVGDHSRYDAGHRSSSGAASCNRNPDFILRSEPSLYRSAMTPRTFQERTRTPPSYRWLRRLTIVVLAIWLPSAAFSGFRAIVQIFDLDLRVDPDSLRTGTVVQADVVTSGRTHADVVLELRQRTTVDTIGSVFVPRNRDGALDPRPRRGSLRVVLTDDQLARFTPGPVTVRAVAVGRSQWMRTPPPTISELSTTVAP